MPLSQCFLEDQGRDAKLIVSQARSVNGVELAILSEDFLLRKLGRSDIVVGVPQFRVRNDCDPVLATKLLDLFVNERGRAKSSLFLYVPTVKPNHRPENLLRFRRTSVM